MEFKELREKLGLTQDGLAKPLGVGKLTISQYETGFRKPGKTVLIMMNVLKVLSPKRSRDLLELMSEQAAALDSKRNRD